MAWSLHGSELRRVKAGLHYIAINLVASSLFLIGVSLIYSLTGTLNMADLAQRIPEVASENRPLLEAGAGVLGVAFLIKSGMYPLCFWLPGTYAAAAPGRGDVLGDDQGRGVRGAAVVIALRSGRELAAVGRGGDDRLWFDWRPRHPGRTRGWQASACSSPPGRCWPPSA